MDKVAKITKITADTTELEQLGKDIVRAKRALLGQLGERGYQLLRAEVPVKLGNLKQGVAPPDVDYANMRAELTVSGRSARTGGTTAQVFGADGKPKKTVTLRPQPAYNYAETVARGRPSIKPKHGKALLIPVASVRSGEGYLLIGGQKYIVRRSAGPARPNPFDERAAKRLETEAPGIADRILAKFV